MATIQEETFASLAEDFGGDLIQPGDAAYDDGRSIFNGMIDRRPALIARPTGGARVQGDLDRPPDAAGLRR